MIKEQLKNQIFWWNKLADSTLVHNARFGAWSEKTVIISLGSLAILFKRLRKVCFFLHPFFDHNHCSIKNPKPLRITVMKKPP